VTAVLMGLLAAGAAVFVLSPLRRPTLPQAPEEDARSGLLRARAAAAQALREADFDRATGKISDADHAELRARHETHTQAILRRLDALDRVDTDGRGDSA
jgi:hypothetical protein